VAFLAFRAQRRRLSVPFFTEEERNEQSLAQQAAFLAFEA
jgi:hypothetical protein